MYLNFIVLSLYFKNICKTYLVHVNIFYEVYLKYLLQKKYKIKKMCY